MSPFRGDDTRLEAEIAALEGIARVRLRRATRELAELDRDLRGLRAERAARRRAASDVRASTAELRAGSAAAAA